MPGNEPITDAQVKAAAGALASRLDDIEALVYANGNDDGPDDYWGWPPTLRARFDKLAQAALEAARNAG